MSDRRLRASRGLAAAGLAARGGLRYTGGAIRLFTAAGEQRQRLRDDLAMRTAQDVTDTLGTMKGVLMKLGQMASYIDDGVAPDARRVLGRLTDSVPPMSPELAAGVVEQELGAPPERVFARWDGQPIAAASIGQVHRAITHDGRAVAVKVQYPGVAESMAADLDNVALLRRLFRIMAPAQDVTELLAELRERMLEELDYQLEARNQRLIGDYFEGHPTISVPGVDDELSTRRVLVSDLANGLRFAEFAGSGRAERDLAGETIYRFVFRCLYGTGVFNGDPHPGNYLFGGDGQVTFLDFGLVRRFSAAEMEPLLAMVRNLCVENDLEAFRASMEEAGFLLPGAPIPTERIADHMAVYYELIRTPGRRTVTPEFSAAVVRRFFDFRDPIAAYVRLPRSYVVLQRINLGLFGVLGELRATADWRRISEEVWPFMQAPPATPMGEAEQPWLATRPRVPAMPDPISP